MLLAFSLLLPLAACSNEASATTMHLKRTEGTVAVSDDTGKDVPLLDDLGLYSGYGVDTRSESYAWIDLDSVKLTKMDQDSEIAIQKDGKDLEIEVISGSLFFNVTEPLEDDETMTIRTSTILVGIRGTCGWVEVPNGGTTKAFLLEGKVRCETDEERETVQAGQMAVMMEDSQITVTGFTVQDIPAFVLEEIEEDDHLAEVILDDSGIDVFGQPGPEPGPEEPTLPTDGNRTVFTGTIDTYTYAEVLALQGISDPNPGQSHTGQTLRLIVLDTPQNMSLNNLPDSEFREGMVSMIDVSYADGLAQYDGQHMTFSIDPASAGWPHGTNLPLGEPLTRDVHVLGAAVGPDRPAEAQTGLPFTEELESTSYTGAGSYHDYILLQPDGTYEEGWSERMLGESHTGRFENITAIDDHTWPMTVAEAEDGYMAIGTEYRLYGPGTPLTEIPDPYQIVLEDQDRAGYRVLSEGQLIGYVIYNMATDNGYSTL